MPAIIKIMKNSFHTNYFRFTLAQIFSFDGFISIFTMLLVHLFDWRSCFSFFEEQEREKKQQRMANPFYLRITHI